MSIGIAILGAGIFATEGVYKALVTSSNSPFQLKIYVRTSASNSTPPALPIEGSLFPVPEISTSFSKHSKEQN